MLSKVNSVISDWLGEQFQPCSSRSRKTFGCAQVCRSDKGWRFSPLYGCGENTTPCPIAWTGYVRPVTINQAMGGKPVFSCSNPIPPVAVATDQPAEHVLSRSAGSKGSSRITVNVISHHSPDKAGKFSGHCCYRNIPLLSMPGQPIVFTPKSGVGLVRISDDVCWIPCLPCNQILGFLADLAFAYTSGCLDQQTPQM